MLTSIQDSLPAGVTLDGESWVAIKNEIATQYIILFLFGVALAAAVAVFVPGLPAMVDALPLPGAGYGMVIDTAILVGMFAIWCGFSLYLQRDMCIGIFDKTDPVKDASHTRWYVNWVVAFFMNAGFAWVMAVSGAFPALVVPALIGPSFMLAATGAEYYARHIGSEDAKAVCRTIYRTHLEPCMVGAALIFAIGIAISVAIFAL